MINITNSAEETIKLAGKLAGKFRDGAVLALIGDLGAGKTTFVQGFAKALGIKNKILSPTFVLMRQYGNFFHLDLYRLEKIKEIESLGLAEIFENPKNIVLIEWAEKAEKLPQNTIYINFEYVDKNKRKITVNG